MLDRDLREDLLRLPPIALEGHEHRHFVPDVFEALVVVRDRLGEDLAVRDVDDPAARLVRVHPDPDLVEGELEQAKVDDVARVGADLHAVPYLEGSAPHDERPASQVGHRILERDRESRPDEAEERRERLHAGEPHPAHDDDAGREQRVRRALAPAVADPRVSDPAVHKRQSEPMQEPEPHDRHEGAEQPRLELGAEPEPGLEPLDHGTAR